uniref:CSON015581 protein n=1 Tax=Culicoides sonorensis TaxID=179676 RepID=A0A336KV82_CULSO
MDDNQIEILCRVCLIDCSESYFGIDAVGYEEKTYKDLIQNITTFIVTDEDPSFVCDGCAIQLIQAFKCRQMLEETQLILNQMKLLKNISNDTNENSHFENFDGNFIEVYVNPKMMEKVKATNKKKKNRLPQIDMPSDWNEKEEDKDCDFCYSNEGIRWSNNYTKVDITLSEEIVHHFKIAHLGCNRKPPTKPVLKLYNFFRRHKKKILWIHCTECEEIFYSDLGVYKHRNDTLHMADFVEDGFKPRESLLPYPIELPEKRVRTNRHCKSIYQVESENDERSD